MPARICTLVITILVLALAAACSAEDPSVAESPSAGAPSTAAPPKVADFIPGLSAGNAAILDSCLAGENAACDRAQEPERLTDGHFSQINAACAEANQDACLLRDRLVEAELRMHCAEGDVSACTS